jgi:hypothetical protein
MVGIVEISSVFSTGITLTYLLSNQFKVSKARHFSIYSVNVLLIGIPLTFRGLCHAFLYNAFCILAITSHLRGAFADPGRMPEGMVSLIYFTQFEINRKHLSKANSWKLRIAKSAKLQASKRPGNQFVLITAKNVDFASSR